MDDLEDRISRCGRGAYKVKIKKRQYVLIDQGSIVDVYRKITDKDGVTLYLVAEELTWHMVVHANTEQQYIEDVVSPL